MGSLSSSMAGSSRMRSSSEHGEAAPAATAPPATRAPTMDVDGLGKTEFVVSMLVSLGCVEWVDAIPVMQHFDMLDQRGAGKLYAEDLELIAAREAQSNTLLQQQKMLAGIASRAGVEKKVTKQSQHIVAAKKYV